MGKVLPPALSDVFAALTTPFQPDGSPALEALDAVVDFGLQKGLRGFCLGGATSEYPASSVEHRVEMFCRVANRTKGRAQLICAVGAEHSGQVKELARAAVDCGAIALLFPPPVFLPYAQQDLVDFIAQISAELPLPVLIYHIPQCTRDLGLANVLHLIATVPNIIGLKDSSGQRSNLPQIQAALAQGRFAFLVGSDDLLFEGFGHGAVGTISGIAGACPDLILPLVRVLEAGDMVLARSLQDALDEYIRHIGGLASPWAIKLSLQVQGLDVGTLAWPMGPNLRQRSEEFQAWFAHRLAVSAQHVIGSAPR